MDKDRKIGQIAVRICPSLPIFEKSACVIKIAHIINPFHAHESSDLFTAQPITFASMLRAKEEAEHLLGIDLLTAQFPEDRDMVPEGFRATRDLERSVLDMGEFEKKLRLPLLSDILQRMYDESDAEYLIYTNVDIGLYPDFYRKVRQFIDAGHDAFIINRRRLEAVYDSVDDLPKIYQDRGKKHPGFDCFVFHRDLFPQFQLEGICIGVPFIEITFSQNLFALSRNFKLYEDEILTFHIGMEIIKGRAPREYFKYNQGHFWAAVSSPLRKHMSLKKLPYSNLLLPFRLIKWGLQPCFPIRLVLQLEVERLGNYFTGRKNASSSGENDNFSPS